MSAAFHAKSETLIGWETDANNVNKKVATSSNIANTYVVAN